MGRYGWSTLILAFPFSGGLAITSDITKCLESTDIARHTHVKVKKVFKLSTADHIRAFAISGCVEYTDPNGTATYNWIHELRSLLESSSHEPLTEEYLKALQELVRGLVDQIEKKGCEVYQFVVHLFEYDDETNVSRIGQFACGRGEIDPERRFPQVFLGIQNYSPTDQAMSPVPFGNVEFYQVVQSSRRDEFKSIVDFLKEEPRMLTADLSESRAISTLEALMRLVGNESMMGTGCISSESNTLILSSRNTEELAESADE